MEITLVPIAGLCNRMNAITSGLLYKMNNPDCQMEILWWKTHDCCADFLDLFEQLPDPYIKVGKMKSFLSKRPGTPRNLYLPRKLRKYFYDFEMRTSYNPDDFDVLTKNKKRVYVACHNRFNKYCIRESLGQIFVPAKELRDRISAFTRDWNNNVVGLHIRRTDNIWAIEQSPIENFYKLMDSEIIKNEDVRFYLATDDNKVKIEMTNKYGNRIITQNLSLCRNSVQGMKDAVVDLYCLGLTSKIFGSNMSTYSTLASQLYNIDLIV